MWLKCMILLCAAYEATSQKPELKIRDVTIDKVEPVGRLPIVPVLKVCYTVANPPAVDHNTLNIVVLGENTDPDIPIKCPEVKTDPPVEANCVYYKGDISTYPSRNIEFFLEGRLADNTPVINAEAIFTLPDLLELGDITALKVKEWAYREGVLDSLRFPSPQSGWDVCDKETSNVVIPTCNPAVVNSPCYAIEVTASSGYRHCKGDRDGGEAILYSNLNTITVIDTIQETLPDEVTLTYGYTDSSSTVNAKLEITTESLEIVAYKDSENIYAFCSDSTSECTLPEYVKNRDDMKIIILGYKEKDQSTSNVLTFHDYKIIGTTLGPSIIEMFWTRGSEKFYGAKVDGDGVHDVAVDCSDDDAVPDNTYCYAYFTGINAAKGQEFHATVYPANNDDVLELDPNKNNQITAEPITPVSADLQRIMGVTLLQDPTYTDDVLQLCYKASESNHTNTRHEAILIDEDGHWMKIYHSTQGEHNMHCFSPVNLLNSSLRITKDTKLTAVILERELNGNKVLASGQKDIDMSALRAIKPEVDNGSNGSTSTLAIVGAAIAGIACLMALVAAAVMFVKKIKRDNDGLQYPLHRTNIEQDSSYIHGLDNPIPTM